MIPIPQIAWMEILTSKWLWLAVAAGFFFFSGVGCEHKRMAKKVESVQQAFDTYVAEAERNVSIIQSENQKAQREAEDRATELFHRYENLQAALTEEVKRYEELKRIALSKRTVELFNNSTRTPDKQEPNPGTTTTSQEDSGKTLADLMEKAIENNIKANACVDQYIELLNLYESIKKNFD